MNKTIEIIKDIRTLCTHIFEGGHRCASPALRCETFCYYHHPTRKPLPKPSPRRSRRQSFDLPLPSGQSELQQAVYEVIRRLAANQISTRHAGRILNALDDATRTPSSVPPTTSSPKSRLPLEIERQSAEGTPKEPKYEDDPENAVRIDSLDPLSHHPSPGPGRPPIPTAAPPRPTAAGPQYQPPPPPLPATPQAQPQNQPAPPPTISPQQLDQLVQRIALYPDPLLAQVLTASTFWDQIADAAAWAQQHSSLTGDALAQAIQADNLPWDPSVLALLPFPSVLDTMARDIQWTGTLGNAVLSQRDQVMDAVQRQRRAAHDYGYLASNPYDTVADNGGYIEIQPVNPAYYYVPVYSPAVVFYAPRPGFVIATGVHFGPSVVIGPAFGVYGWYGAGFGWGGHAIFIDHRPWTRTYYNRNVYVHPYSHPYSHPTAPRVETHAEPHYHNGDPHHH